MKLGDGCPGAAFALGGATQAPMGMTFLPHGGYVPIDGGGLVEDVSDGFELATGFEDDPGFELVAGFELVEESGDDSS